MDGTQQKDRRTGTKKMTETHVLHCWSPTDSIILTLGTIPHGNRLVKPRSLIATEVNRILRGLRHQEKCCFQFLCWLMLAHAVLSVPLLLCVSDCRLVKSAIKAYWSISKKLCGRGKIPPLLSDSNPVSVFPGEIKDTICKLTHFFKLPAPTAVASDRETYKVTVWFSSVPTAVVYFPTQYFTQGFPGT